ncbi:BREX-1 system adenine-specific DNA-methyltransferase PglX [Pseudomonas sp. TMP25]|uniref:BREX-1 system adenine-specific DNA-methyltransferase PglX n=1 Tax=Pseudomonas sp. TMP25 TaxID=3136561 RepID=UPI003100F1EA
MNRSALKKYAPQARLDFIEAVTLRARRLGLDPALPVSVGQTGDVLLIAGQPFPASVAKQRLALVQRIQQQGFSAVVEALAYTWFNRLVAIRFMELKGYLSHGYRVLSHPQGQQPEILDHVQHLELPGLDKAEVIRLKTAGNQDEALYREILLAQCHELHRNMPFLFEALDDATELLLPDNLLRTDSPIAHLVSDIEEADWQEVEVIGWLYQFYISDKKDEVIGKVVKSEDIPAATQLFTPNWIVQYLVQNSLGRLWLMANPGSNLKEKMPYYIEPAEQTPEVQAQLDALIKVRMDEDGGTLNPESLTLLDPACGSGHILVEAYNLLRAIYEERGYRLREIPRLILQKNLFGLDIDDRAAQLAGFALLMKARKDDRRLFDEEGNPPHLNVMAIQQSAGLPDEEIAEAIMSAAIRIDGGEAFHSDQLFGGGQLETLHSSGLVALDLRELIQLFEHGKTFGSLISVPDVLKLKLSKIVDLLASVRSQGDDLSRSYASQVLEQFAWPASLLALQYDAVVANPPYMGGKGMYAQIKDYAKSNYPSSRYDLFSMFMERGFELCKKNGFNSMVVMQGWMFLSTFESLRKLLIKKYSIMNLIRIGFNSFPDMNSKIAQASSFVMMNGLVSDQVATFIDLNTGNPSEDKKTLFLTTKSTNLIMLNQSIFNLIPGGILAFWLPRSFISAFSRGSISDVFDFRKGLMTADNDRFIRDWHEVDSSNIAFHAEQGKKWYLIQKGGPVRGWYGNNNVIVNWEEDGRDIKSFSKSIVPSKGYYFKPGVTWTTIAGSNQFRFRYIDGSYLFEAKGSCGFPKDGSDIFPILAYGNSIVCQKYIEVISPTIDFESGSVSRLPWIPGIGREAADLAKKCIDLVKYFCSLREDNWEFYRNQLTINFFGFNGKIQSSWSNFNEKLIGDLESLNKIEMENDRLFINAFDLQKDLSPLDRANDVLYLLPVETELKNLISYIIGCMMGRYSLDEPSLIYAHAGNVGFDASRYATFPADTDGIIPITDESWFEDDAAERVREFVKVVWGSETLVENMEWLADGLGRKAGESADEAIRRYLSTNFYKDHLQTYKKRPIYWLFSSGKQKAFECLVYLHRYNEGTLSRMRMEYVVPLQSRMQARIDKLTDDIDSATSSAQQKALQKRKDKLTKQLEELRRFDENLRPYADQRTTLDLDDGVKVNYGKFGNLLAEVKAITGGKDE